MSKEAHAATECPKCGSANIAKILWGMPAMSKELERSLEEGHIILGGCCVTGFDPDWHCNECGCEFGDRVDAYEACLESRQEKLKGVIYGAAVGDALGVPCEFMERDSFECVDMVGGGSHNMPAGTFSDDTSMLIATCDSIKQCGKIDIEDMRERFKVWMCDGKYTPDGRMFDIGDTTDHALESGIGQAGERDNGNGSLMRIAPVAFIRPSDDEVRSVSAITHAHWISTEACLVLVRLLDDLIYGEYPEDAINANVPDSGRFAFLRELEDMPRDEIRSSGFVLDTLGAALWCLLHTHSFRDCVLTAVNLGDDSDTTACVAGALAGARYGYDTIPQEWIDALRGKEQIEDCLFDIVF